MKRKFLRYSYSSGLIFGELILNIVFYKLFYFLEGVTVTSCTDNITPYNVNKTKVIKETEHYS